MTSNPKHPESYGFLETVRLVKILFRNATNGENTLKGYLLCNMESPHSGFFWEKHTETAFQYRSIEAQKDFVVLSKIFQVTQAQRDTVRELCLFVSVLE